MSILSFFFIGLAAFTVADYTMGRLGVPDIARVIVATAFALLVALFVSPL